MQVKIEDLQSAFLLLSFETFLYNPNYAITIIYYNNK